MLCNLITKIEIRRPVCSQSQHENNPEWPKNSSQEMDLRIENVDKACQSWNLWIVDQYLITSFSFCFENFGQTFFFLLCVVASIKKKKKENNLRFTKVHYHSFIFQQSFSLKKGSNSSNSCIFTFFIYRWFLSRWP